MSFKLSKIALISDVHGNYPALKAVVERLEKENPNQWICLGDIVGYGPNSKECIDEIREREMICVLGNHDAGVIGILPLKYFRSPNKKLIEITKSQLPDEQINWLSNLPLTVLSDENTWIAAHASPENPSEWEYLESAFKIRPLLSSLEQKFCFIGHTHRPAIVSDTIGVQDFNANNKYFINPGSVGQPRDGIKKASGSIVDTDNFEYKNFRVEFDLAKVLFDLEKLGFSKKETEHLMRVK